MNWVKGLSPRKRDHLEEHYQRVIMKGSADPKIQLIVFRDQLLKKILRARQPLKGPSVEMNSFIVLQKVVLNLKLVTKCYLLDITSHFRIQVCRFCILSVKTMIPNSEYCLNKSFKTSIFSAFLCGLDVLRSPDLNTHTNSFPILILCRTIAHLNT